MAEVTSSWSDEGLCRLNLEAKQRRSGGLSAAEAASFYTHYLSNTEEIKAVTLCFSDLEGRLHMLDYDKDFLLRSYDNLTFDGSSVNGFANVAHSDLRFEVDWEAIYWLPTTVFGPHKVLLFASIRDKNGGLYPADLRSRLKGYLADLSSNKGLSSNVAVECEGFLLDGLNAEQNYSDKEGFRLVSTGGYFHSLPRDRLRMFIDSFAAAKRAVGFENEKDHPEVAPSQFELNYRYADALIAADQLQLYKLMARQIAANHGMTASFLPKPISGINGSGMHTNISLAQDGANLFFNRAGEGQLSDFARQFVERVLSNATELCLTLNSSVNAYRRQDPAFEAPNQIKSSANDRTSMIRIPLGNSKTARIEVRTVAPDANPYLVFYLLLRVGLEGPTKSPSASSAGLLPGCIQDAIAPFQSSALMAEYLGRGVRDKYCELKQAAARRCPHELGSRVKEGEIHFHHEITNQFLWGRF